MGHKECPMTVRDRVADWLIALAALVQSPRAPDVACTDIAATWCPVHGDCLCRPPCPECGSPERGVDERAGGAGAFYLFQCADCGLVFENDGDFEKNDRRCPLHGPTSEHACGPTED